VDRRHHGWSDPEVRRTARRCRTIQIEAGVHTITAADPLPDDLRHISCAFDQIINVTHSKPSTVTPVRTNVSQVG
jgi:hypothetical protein